jgi:prepilin-type N-terminal cleavage/methylation domain-containing protein
MLSAEFKFPAKRHKVSAFSLQPSAFASSAFTLVEMLVVISILGILAGLTVPALKNLGKSNAALSASRQLLDGVARARQQAIAKHTTVYMVFLPTNFWDNVTMNNLTPAQQTEVINLCDMQLSGFTFIAQGAVGDQPGRHAWHYLDPWRALPDNAFIAPSKFTFSGPFPAMVINDSASGQVFNIYGFAAVKVPFPTADAPPIFLPCIAFNYLGQLTSALVTPAPLTQHEYIPLVRGSVLPAMDPSSKALKFGPALVSETPPGNSTNSAYNLVDIDPLTGRATLKFQKVQ